MSELTKSARAVPKCKGCGQPRKGHAGPTGLTKCQNIVDKISKMNLAGFEENNANAITADLKEVKKNEETIDSLSIINLTVSEVVSAVVGEASHIAEKEDPDEVLHPEKKVDNNLESTRAIPKCKACGQPRKGHTGPTGLSKCQISKMNLDEVDNNELATDPQKLKNKTVEDISVYLNTSHSSSQIPHVDSLSIAKSTISEVISVVVGLADTAEQDTPGSVAEKTPGSVAEKTPGNFRISSVCDYENFLSESAMADIDEVLRPEKKTASDGVNGERLGSLGEDLDIRNVLREKTFLLCECEKLGLGECDCKGILDFNADMVGILLDVFDFTPDILCKKSSWKKKSPNEMIFGLEHAPVAGKSSVKGTVNLKAWRLVTLVKGKKHLSIDIKADIEVKKMKFKKVFQLIEQEVVEQEEDSRVEEDEEKSSEDEVPSEDSDNEVFKDNAQDSPKEHVTGK